MSVWDPGEGVVEFPDGRRVRGGALRRAQRDGLDPEFGVYLVAREPNIAEWPHLWVRWRDFRLPDSSDDAVAALREAHARAESERVDVACRGGVGRTGTALAVMAVMSGVGVEDAVTWVREHYHSRAVETRRQRAWIREVSASLND